MNHSETGKLRPPMGPEKGGLYLQVVFISRSILHFIRTVCSEKCGLTIQLVFLDSCHIIQVSLYVCCFSGQKNFPCKVCDKWFGTAGAVKHHMKIHNGQREHLCEVCSKTYVNLSNLRQHMKVHANHKEFVCKVSVLNKYYQKLIIRQKYSTFFIAFTLTLTLIP